MYINYFFIKFLLIISYYDVEFGIYVFFNFDFEFSGFYVEYIVVLG